MVLPKLYWVQLVGIKMQEITFNPELSRMVDPRVRVRLRQLHLSGELEEALLFHLIYYDLDEWPVAEQVLTTLEMFGMGAHAPS